MKEYMRVFSMIRLRKKILKEIVALSIFSFLAGICIALLLKNSFMIVKQYTEAFSYQINNLHPDKNKILISVLGNRIVILSIVYICSYFFKGRYFPFILSGLFFFFYGIYFFINCLAIGVKCLLTSLLFFVPQWLFYVLGCAVCIYYNNVSEKISIVLKLIRSFIPFLFIIIGSIIETYVTLPMVIKIF